MRQSQSVVWGIILIAVGLLLLLGNLDVVANRYDVMALLFALVAAGFWYLLIRDRDQWWAAIPGGVFVGLAFSVGLDHVPGVSPWTGSLFLGSIGFGFAMVYLSRRENWWALIPAGVLTTLAVVAALDRVPGWDKGFVFFLGLSLTFLLVALAPAPSPNRWAVFPAGALFIFALLIGTGVQAVLRYLGPVALILAGVYLLVQRFRGR